MKIALLLYQTVKYSEGSEYGRPIDSTQGVPDYIVNWAAPIGFIFLGIVIYSYYKSRRKK